MSKRLDLRGQRFGRLVALAFVNKQGRSAWTCRCDCGQETIVQTSKLRQGIAKGCGCRSRKSQWPAEDRALRRAWHAYKTGINTRKRRPFSLGFVEFKAIVCRPCHYCGSEPALTRWRAGNFSFSCRYNGIDRADNKKGYEKENIVPCCGPCNRAKRDLSIVSFKALVSRIYHKTVVPELGSAWMLNV